MSGLSRKTKSDWVVTALVWLIGAGVILGMFALCLAIGAGVVHFVWHALAVPFFGWPGIEFWQSLAISLLINIATRVLNGSKS